MKITLTFAAALTVSLCEVSIGNALDTMTLEYYRNMPGDVGASFNSASPFNNFANQCFEVTLPQEGKRYEPKVQSEFRSKLSEMASVDSIDLALSASGSWGLGKFELDSSYSKMNAAFSHSSTVVHEISYIADYDPVTWTPGSFRLSNYGKKTHDEAITLKKKSHFFNRCGSHVVTHVKKESVLGFFYIMTASNRSVVEQVTADLSAGLKAGSSEVNAGFDLFKSAREIDRDLHITYEVFSNGEIEGANSPLYSVLEANIASPSKIKAQLLKTIDGMQFSSAAISSITVQTVESLLPDLADLEEEFIDFPSSTELSIKKARIFAKLAIDRLSELDRVREIVSTNPAVDWGANVNGELSGEAELSREYDAIIQYFGRLTADVEACHEIEKARVSKHDGPADSKVVGQACSISVPSMVGQGVAWFTKIDWGMEGAYFNDEVMHFQFSPDSERVHSTVSYYPVLPIRSLDLIDSIDLIVDGNTVYHLSSNQIYAKYNQENLDSISLRGTPAASNYDIEQYCGKSDPICRDRTQKINDLLNEAAKYDCNRDYKVKVTDTSRRIQIFQLNNSHTHNRC